VSVRFLVLFPQDWAEVAMAAHVLDILRRTHPDAWIGRLIQNDIQWISDGYSGWDDTITFEKTPGEKKSQIRELLPDYLIDLSSNSRFWLFKNKVKLVDFSFSSKSVRIFRQTQDPEEKYTHYLNEALNLLSVFDPVEPLRISWQTDQKNKLGEFIPKAFLKGYLSLNLDDFGPSIYDYKDSLIRVLGILEYPVVLVGSHRQKEFGDVLCKTVGCTVFNTAGDMEAAEMRLIYSGGKMLMGTGSTLQTWAFLTNKKFVDLKEEVDVEQLGKQVRQIL
jgi:hypothetical protein